MISFSFLLMETTSEGGRWWCFAVIVSLSHWWVSYCLIWVKRQLKLLKGTMNVPFKCTQLLLWTSESLCVGSTFHCGYKTSLYVKHIILDFFFFLFAKKFHHLAFHLLLNLLNELKWFSWVSLWIVHKGGDHQPLFLQCFIRLRYNCLNRSLLFYEILWDALYQVLPVSKWINLTSSCVSGHLHYLKGADFSLFNIIHSFELISLGYCEDHFKTAWVLFECFSF